MFRNTHPLTQVVLTAPPGRLNHWIANMPSSSLERFSLRQTLRSACRILLIAVFVCLIFSPGDAQESAGKAKTNFAVLLDNTRSMQRQLPQVISLGKACVKRIYPEGPVSLFTFVRKRNDWSVMTDEQDAFEGGEYDRAVSTVAIERSEDEQALYNVIDGLSLVTGQTDLFGAIRAMAEFLNTASTTPKEESFPKIIILITDGDHRMQGAGRTETEDYRRKERNRLISYLSQNGIKVYVLGLTRDLDTSSNADRGSAVTQSRRLKAEDFLLSMTKKTGGRAIISTSRKTDAEKTVNQLLPN
jgi:hypothetical protein